MEKERRTSGESSSSTEIARRAVLARWGVGNGISRVLGDSAGEYSFHVSVETYNVQGNSISVSFAMARLIKGENTVFTSCSLPNGKN